MSELKRSRSKTIMNNNIEDSSSNYNAINLLENISPKKGCRFNSTNNSNVDEDSIPSKSFSFEEDDERVDDDDERRAILITAANNSINNISLKVLHPRPTKRSTLLPRTSLNSDRDNGYDGNDDIDNNNNNEDDFLLSSRRSLYSNDSLGYSNDNLVLSPPKNKMARLKEDDDCGILSNSRIRNRHRRGSLYFSEDEDDDECSNVSNNNTLFTPNKLFNSNNDDDKEMAISSPSRKLYSPVGGAPRVLTPVPKKHAAIGTNSNYNSNSDTLTPVPPQRISNKNNINRHHRTNSNTFSSNLTPQLTPRISPNPFSPYATTTTFTNNQQQNVIKSPNPFSQSPYYQINNIESLHQRNKCSSGDDTNMSLCSYYSNKDTILSPQLCMPSSSSPKKKNKLKPKSKLTVHTDSSSNNINNSMFFDNDCSPTDVLSFPTFRDNNNDAHHNLPPATPFKARSSKNRRTPIMKRTYNNTSTFFNNYSDDDDLSMPFTKQISYYNRFESDFDILGTIGKGSFGTVYQCMSKLDGVMYAIKETKRQAKSLVDKQCMLKEVYALAALSDQGDVATFHIVRYHQAWMSNDARLYIQTELCTHTLAQEIQLMHQNNQVMDEKRKYKLLREILLALDLLHRNHMVHLDIKPDNIFIKNNKYKLGDFGLASKDNVNDVDEEGDSRYMSKELLTGDYNDLTKCDIFSLGSTMYEVCINTTACSNNTEYKTLPANGQLWHDIREGKLLSPQHTSYELRTTIMVMIHSNPNERPTANYLLENKRQLLSDERKLILLERNKAAEAMIGLKMKMKQLLEESNHATGTTGNNFGPSKRATLTRSRSCF